MPTNYTGDKNATQAPGFQPFGGAHILIRLPVDGDNLNGSTFAQAFKALADYVDFAFNPQARGDGTPGSFVPEIIAYSTALGHRRFGIDHLGFPGGRYFTKEIVWAGTGTAGANGFLGANTGAQFPTMSDWRYKSNTASAGNAGVGASPYCPTMVLGPGTGSGEYVTISAGEYGDLRVDNHVVVEFLAWLLPAANVRFSLAVTELPGDHVDNESNWMGFRVDGAGNWLTVTKAAGLETVNDSLVVPAVYAGVTPPRPNRLRMEWHGANVADNAQTAARFYIDGNLVATHTTNLPIDQEIGLAIGGLRSAAWASGNNGQIFVGPGRLAVSTLAEDSFL